MLNNERYERIKKQNPEVIECYAFMKDELGLTFTLDFFIDNYFELKKKFPREFENYYRYSVEMEELNKDIHQSQEDNITNF